MRPFAVALAVLLPAVAVAQFKPPIPGGGPKAKNFGDVAEVSAKFEPAQAKPGETVKLLVTVTPRPGAWTYALVQPNGQDAKMTLPPPKVAAVAFAGPAADPDGWKDKPGPEAGSTERYYPNPVTWTFTGTVYAVPAGKFKVDWEGVRIQACNKDNCFNSRPADLPELELEVLAGPGGVAPPSATAPATPPTTAPTPPAKAKATGTEKQELFWFLLQAAGWGLITLITPCVFPMIPITVSLFLKQSQNSTAGAVKQAGIYCLTIIVMLGVPTAFLLDRFTKLSVDPYMNVFLGGLFVFFAVSLFGAYEATIRLTFGFLSVLGGALAVTSAIVTHVGLSRGELEWATESEGVLWKWVTVFVCATIAGTLLATARPGSQDGLVKFADARRKAGGVLGTVFGAMLFSVISFTCVAPFLGAFAGLASGGEYATWELVLAGLSFSTAFASPFFVLAMFPSLIKKMPKSGGWLDVVKAVMGFVELAAAFKFARTAELRWLDPPEYFTYSVCLTAFAVISGVCGLYLLGVFRLPHDDEEKAKLSVPRMLFATAFLGLGVYLVPGLFQGADGQNQRPKGVVFAWVDSFLLPDTAPAASAKPDGRGEQSSEKWSRDLEATKKEAAARVMKWEEAKKANPSAAAPDKRLVFIDFTGVTCSNCKLNERNVFPRPEVAELLKRYAEVQLYTDTVPKHLYSGAVPADAARNAEAQQNKKYQVDSYGTEQLPLYVILEVKADGSTNTLGVYPEGKINDVPAFVEFLRKPLEGK